MHEETSTVVFADLAGFTALTEAHGDHDALEIVGRLEAFAAAAVTTGVRIVKTVGDAVMLAGPEVPDAVTVAFDLVAAAHSEPRFPLVSVGMHSGSVLVRDGDLFGATVNLAARVASIAEPGQVLGTEPVADAARAAGCASVRALGSVALRNLPGPVALFELARCDLGVDAVTLVDPVCRMRLDVGTVHAVRVHAGREWAFCSRECADRFTADPDRYQGDA